MCFEYANVSAGSLSHCPPERKTRNSTSLIRYADFSIGINVKQSRPHGKILTSVLCFMSVHAVLKTSDVCHFEKEKKKKNT